MPELPEVETVKRGLARLLPGKVVTHVDFDWPKSFPNAASDVQEFLIGAKILEVKRRAKVLLIELDSKYSLIIHLKMTGQLVFRGEESFGAGHPNDSLVGKLPDKSTRVVFTLSNNTDKDAALESSSRKVRSTERGVHTVRRVSTGEFDAENDQERWRSFGLSPKPSQGVAHLYFNDQRKFGWVRLLPTAEVPNIDFFKRVGPEPLSNDFTAKEFIQRIRRRNNTSVKAALLDQTVVAGIGNIYADEALFGAKIHPELRVKDVSDAKLQKLYQAARDVLQLSIDKGGSSDKNYVNAEGKRGSYLGFAKVFRREGQPCAVCGHTIEKIRVAGRGTHICPIEQKLPKGYK